MLNGRGESIAVQFNDSSLVRGEPVIVLFQCHDHNDGPEQGRRGRGWNGGLAHETAGLL